MIRPRLLWVTDPWDTLDHASDTTLRLVEESLALGVESHWCDVKSIHLLGRQSLLRAQQVLEVAPGRQPDGFRLGPAQVLAPRAFTRIIYRTDPPIDLAYLHPLQILALGIENCSETEIVNPLESLFISNEKLEGTLYGDLMPPSCAASQWDILREFGLSEGKTVLKPLHEAQSKGVQLLDWSTEEGVAKARDALADVTEQFRRPAILQRYLPEIHQGEQRLWFINGELLAVARKIPRSGEFRINMDQGGSLAASDLDDKEQTAARIIGARLKARRIRLAAVDLIGGWVTDANFTSPGLIAAMEKVLKRNLARPIIESLIQPFPST